MSSLSRRLVLGTTVATAAVLVTAGGWLYVLARGSLVDQFDRSMTDKARLLASTVERDGGRIELEFEELDMREFDAQARPAYLQVWRADGSVLFRSSSLGEAHLERIAGAVESPVCRDLTLPNGRAGRAVGLTFRPRPDGAIQGEARGEHEDAPRARRHDAADTVTLTLARDIGPIYQTLVRLATLLVSVGAVAIVVSAGVLWWVIRRGLRPLDRLAIEISRVGEEDLSRQLDTQNAPRELQPVIDRLNDLLRRLGAAFQRERSFAADVAHELRTPLAGLRLKMDVAMSKLREPREYQQAIGECQKISAQMQTMVENLLSLARLEAGHVEIKEEAVLLNELVRDSWKPLKESADSRRLQVRWALEPDIRLVTDRSQLGVVVRNILGNAVAYTDDRGVVEIETAAKDNEARICVSNSGSRLSEDQLEQAFQRLWRGDRARSDPGTHCGLGLSLVRKIVAVLGGSVAARSSIGGQFQIVVSIPNQRHASVASPEGVGV